MMPACYSLIISIRTPRQDADPYATITQQIAAMSVPEVEVDV
jgi:hypothetical protein